VKKCPHKGGGKRIKGGRGKQNGGDQEPRRKKYRGRGKGGETAQSSLHPVRKKHTECDSSSLYSFFAKGITYKN